MNFLFGLSMVVGLPLRLNHMTDATRLIFAIVFSLIMVWIIKLYIKKYREQKRAFEEGAMISAELLPDEVIGKSIIKYEIDGTEYSQKMNIPEKSDSTEVAIRYDRNNPKCFVLDGKEPRMPIFVFIFSGALLLGFVADAITLIVKFIGNI